MGGFSLLSHTRLKDALALVGLLSRSYIAQRHSPIHSDSTNECGEQMNHHLTWLPFICCMENDAVEEALKVLNLLTGQEGRKAHE